MRKILVDSSVWISYFKDKRAHPQLDRLISHSQICTNDLILAELVPYLQLHNRSDVVESLYALPNIPLLIDWELIINLQLLNLRNGINRVGIPDLIIVDHVFTNNLILFTEDKHFGLIKRHFSFELFGLN